ncbi:hypothetical protein BH09MYX1_BH09MYX1_08320 [soil metagenome]
MAETPRIPALARAERVEKNKVPAMDRQDLCGFLRGLFLVAIVAEVGRAPTRDDFERILHGRFRTEANDIAIALEELAGVDRSLWRLQLMSSRRRPTSTSKSTT